MNEPELVSGNVKGEGEEMPQALSPTSAFLAELRQKLKDKRARGWGWGHSPKNQLYHHPTHPHLAPSHSAGEEGGEWMGVGWVQKEHET